MRALVGLARRFVRAERGATAIEYALIAGLVAVGMLAGLSALGGGTGASWSGTAERVIDAMGGR